MYHYLHVLLLCLAGAAVCWGMTLSWQADVVQSQCNALLWIVYVPASFMVQLVNMKAYRLSTFLSVDVRPKPFSHSKAMRLALTYVMPTLLLVLISALADPPRRHRVSVDPYRAQLDRYYCKCHGLTYVLMYILVIWHFLVSVLCVVKVRNGLEAFKDGMIMKESFVILYMSVLAAAILQHLGFSPEYAYMLRSILICFGVTCFLTRLLLNRCLRHWTPMFLQRRFAVMHQSFILPVLQHWNVSPSSQSSHRRSSSLLFDDDGPLYAVRAPLETNLAEVTNALKDPARLALLRKFAKQFFVSESIDFLVDVMDLKQSSEREVRDGTWAANAAIHEKAKSLYRKYIIAGAESEVNVSFTVRAQVEKLLRDWPLHKPILTEEQVSYALEHDEHKRGHLFEPAYHEILVMLYQNIWIKFRTWETESIAGGRETGGESVFD